jgi:hypothetical protein
MKGSRLGAALVLLAVAACGTADPTAAIRDRLAAAEKAAEARDTGFFRDLLAESYRDDRGNDRAASIQLLRGFFLANQKVEIVSRIDEIKLEGDRQGRRDCRASQEQCPADAARAVVHAGLVGQRAGAAALGGLHGDLYRFELELVNESGDWRIIGARWQRAIGE